MTGRAGGSILPAKPSNEAAAASNPLKPGPELSEAEEVPDVDELEEFDEVADVFESTYNFRFEEP